MKSEETLVLVTGASGFLGLHCVALLLERGYRVRGTVRSLSTSDTLVQALGARGLDLSKLSLVAADLGRDEGWTEAAEGCHAVLHVASPFPAAEPRDADELIVPAREGALRVLRAASAARVSRVVMTSSEAAVRSGHGASNARVFDEGDWSDLGGHLSAYERSKTVAERAAWEFVDSLPPERKVELVTILPTLILGPLLRADASTSGELIRRMLVRADPGCADLAFPIVDVRDVAEAHVAALREPNAAGQRFLCGPTESTPMVEIASVLSEHFGPRGFSIRRWRMPNWLVRAVALIDPSVRLIVPWLGLRPRLSNQRLRSTLGIEPRSAREAILSMAESMIEMKVVPLPA